MVSPFVPCTCLLLIAALVLQFPKAYKIDNLTAEFFPELHSKRVIMKYGPFDVEPMSVQNNGMVDYLMLMPEMWCKDCVSILRRSDISTYSLR